MAPTDDMPCLEVLGHTAHEASPEWPRGTRWRVPSVRPGLVLGAAATASVVFHSSLVGTQQCAVELFQGRPWVRHLGATRPTLLDGRPVLDAGLAHGAVLELPDGHVLRYLERPWVDAESPELEAAVLQGRDDDSVWDVWSDWLTQAGDVRGERVRPGFRHRADDARFLGVLASALVDGRLEVTWHRGLPERAVVRRLSRFAPSPRAVPVVTQLPHHPAFRFLRTLEVDVTSLASPGRELGAVEATLSALARGGLPRLEQLTLRPFDASLLGPAHRRLFDDVAAALPALRTAWPHLCVAPAAASLEVLTAPAEVRVEPPVGSRFVLTPGRDVVLGAESAGAVRLRVGEGSPAEGARLRLEYADDTFWAVDARAEGLDGPGGVLVNGVPRLEARLRPGDVLEPLPGVTLRFHG